MTSQADSEATTLQFLPFKSKVDAAFWSHLSELKLDSLGLSEDALSVVGSYDAGRNDKSAASSPMQLTFESLSDPAQAGLVRCGGTLVIKNSLQRLRLLDRKHEMQKAAERLWSALMSGDAEQQPQLLTSFLLYVHADLKTYSFTYWFACPALKPAAPFKLLSSTNLANTRDAENIIEACTAWHAEHAQQPCWLVTQDSNGTACAALSQWQAVRQPGGGTDGTDGSCMLAFIDPSAHAGVPGWPLRNILLMCCARFHWTSVKVLCLRSMAGRWSAAASELLHIELPRASQSQPSLPTAVGWQLDDVSGKPSTVTVHLGEAMDAKLQAQQAVELNIRLMRWRAAPTLHLAPIFNASCLLLGCGTLGCEVARTLLGWGVKQLTLVDAGRVSFSNPVRQSLYEFADCLNGGRQKAHVAAEKLKSVSPGVDVRGIDLAIPMPGHCLSASHLASQQQAYEQLQQLIESHDAVFLLTDTRESRWLPTLLGAAHNKIVINAALGFDGFVVMRHGGSPAAVRDGARRLGCYFCNDVMAPTNSTADRALDQQCTVARPGLARIASGLAVEMLMAMLQHDHAVKTPPAQHDGVHAVHDGAALGAVPHQIRGQLHGFSQTCLVGYAFEQCTACSACVVDAHARDGWQFVQSALQDPLFLEHITGLTALKVGFDERMTCVGTAEDSMENGKAASLESHMVDNEEQAELADNGEDDWLTL